MKTYTEKEVEKLLQTQRGNCWVALNKLTKEKTFLDSVINSPEPGMWRNKKEYYIIAETLFIIDLDEIPCTKEYDLEDLKAQIKNIGILPSDFKKEKTTSTVKIEISKETKDFLECNCNTEKINFDEKIYVLNNLRFKIIEE